MVSRTKSLTNIHVYTHIYETLNIVTLCPNDMPFFKSGVNIFL